MSLTDVKGISLEYRTLMDDVVRKFYIPCLMETYTYKRAVGFFNSTVLLQIAQGLSAIAEKGGKIQLLVSPKLSKEDYEAIKKGYDLRKKVEENMIDSFDEEVDFFQKEDRLALLSQLISKKILDVKVAVPVTYEKQGMYHEKLGIMKDCEGNIVAFSGSANESDHGYNINYECIDVFCSWRTDSVRCDEKELAFDRMWREKDKQLYVIPFPEVIRNKLIKYEKSGYKYDFSQQNSLKIEEELLQYLSKKNLVSKPTDDLLSMLYSYQKDAIDTWVNNGYKGIFDMATGTGKTYTGCGAITKLFCDKKRLFVVIVCPYIHLVEQWAEEVRAFKINPIVGYGSKNYEQKLEKELFLFKRKKVDFVCFITTNSSFPNEKIQVLIRKNLSETLLLVDEAHNFGAGKISECMKVDYPYRLALSATIERYGDEEGTKKLYDFFGQKCIEYTLSKAIQEQKLTPYKYHPILVFLNDDEREKYYDLSRKISKYSHDDQEISETLKRLLIKRARVVAGAKNKIDVLLETIEPYKNDRNLLIYCGAVTYGDYGYKQSTEDIKQIDLVIKELNQKFKMVVGKFTAEENSEERKRIIENYRCGSLQALVAIKCLDEGVNIPAIKIAFILASGTNPKEYIQRRGRVLRKFEGKDFAEVYDFITLPRPFDGISYINESERKIDLSLVKREFTRLVDFANLSMNPSESNSFIDEIREAYKLDVISFDNEREV